MRIAAAAGGLAILVVLAVFGVVLAQKLTLPSPAPEPVAVAAPAAAAEPPIVVATVTERAPSPTPVSAPTVLAQVPARGTTPTAAQPVPAVAAPPATATPNPPPASVAPPVNCAGNPNALGVARVVEIDTTGGPGFGFEHFKTHDFLRPGEVVLTFDDGPWPRNTPAVLAALAAHCTKAIFFPIGQHAMWEPGILKQVAAAGHAIGSHTWSHQDLSKKTGKFKVNGKLQTADFDPKDEIEKGISAVRWAAGVPTAPFFRFPALRHPPEVVTYLGTRNIAMFSTDLDLFDFKMKKADQVVAAVMAKLKKHGKGIVLMHDFQHATAEAAPLLLSQLKSNGYKIVSMVPKAPVTTIASYDELILKDNKLPTVSGQPTSSVVRTLSE